MSREYVRADKPQGRCWITTRTGVWKAIAGKNDAGWVHRHLCPGDPGALHPAKTRLLLVFSDFIMIVTHVISPGEFHRVACGWQKGDSPILGRACISTWSSKLHGTASSMYPGCFTVSKDM